MKQSLSSGIWTLVADFISYDDNHYIKQALSYLPTPPLEQDMTQGQFLSGVLTGLNSEFSFS